MIGTTAALVPLTNARTLAVQIRRLADNAEGDERRKLRDLVVKAERLADELRDALGS